MDKVGGHYRPDGLVKVPYDRHQGRITAHRMNGRVYRCLTCDKWHVTKQKKYRKNPPRKPLEG